jgi:hypothetical protein
MRTHLLRTPSTDLRRSGLESSKCNLERAGPSVPPRAPPQPIMAVHIPALRFCVTRTRMYSSQRIVTVDPVIPCNTNEIEFARRAIYRTSISKVSKLGGRPFAPRKSSSDEVKHCLTAQSDSSGANRVLESFAMPSSIAGDRTCQSLPLSGRVRQWAVRSTKRNNPLWVVSCLWHNDRCRPRLCENGLML